MLSHKSHQYLGSYTLPKNTGQHSLLTRYKKKALPLLLASFLGTLTLGAAAADNQIKLPELGTVASSSLTIEKELRIGKAYKILLRNQLPIITDPLLEQYINDIGLSMVANANDVKTPFDFFIVEDQAINAFAFFGGHVGIHSGLLLLADNESELAAVLGHEITHVTQRHLARSIEARSSTSTATLASLLGSIALVLAGAGDVGIAGIQASLAVSQQLAINYTRSNEKEADRIGIDLSARSNFDPRSAATFFTKLAAQHRYSTKLPPMLLSHPVTELRIAESRVRAQGYPKIKPPIKLKFLLAKARLMTRFNDSSQDSINHNLKVTFDQKDSKNQQAFAYGKSLVAFSNKDYKLAHKLLAPLIKHSPDNLFYIDTLTDILLATNQAEKAVKLLKNYDELMLNNPVISLNYASALIQHKQYELAILKLERFLEQHPESVPGWSMLFDANRKGNHPVEQHVAVAERHALYGNFKGALKELYKANNKIENDILTKAKVQSRIKQLREMEQSLKKLKI